MRRKNFILENFFSKTYFICSKIFFPKYISCRGILENICVVEISFRKEIYTFWKFYFKNYISKIVLEILFWKNFSENFENLLRYEIQKSLFQKIKLSF